MALRHRGGEQSPLRELSLFRGMNDAELARIERLATPVDVPAGEVLTVEGGAGREAFIVLEGEAEVAIQDVVLCVVGPGEVVGEMALLDHHPRSASVTARTPMRILVFDPRAFATLLELRPVMTQVMANLSERLRAAEGATRTG